MQAASVRSSSTYLFTHMGRLSVPSYLCSVLSPKRLLGQCCRKNQGSTPLALLALLLFVEPSEFTLQKFVELLTFGEDSHQLQAAIQLITYSSLSLFLSDAIHPLMLFSSLSISLTSSVSNPSGIEKPSRSARSSFLNSTSHIAKAYC